MPLSFHLFGPVSIHLYGLFIVLGLSTLLYALAHDSVSKKILSLSQLYSLTTYGIIAGVVGGKILYLIEILQEHAVFQIENFAFWQGGFSILGSVIGIACVVIGFVRYYNLPFFVLADRITLYTPLAQCIARFGCFFVGCCSGIATSCFLGITYTNPESLAPLNVPLHPTQLYSAFLLGTIFVLLFTVGQKFLKKPGQLLASYLILMSIERFCVDFLRDDHTPILNNFSLMQLVAAAIGIIGCVLMSVATFTTLLSSYRLRQQQS